MTYDAKDGYVVLYGGAGNNCLTLGDTWKFVGGVWTNITPSHSPGPRYGAGLTYDAKDGYVVLFGGGYETQYWCTVTKLYHDTWRFSGGKWTRITTAVSPSARANLVMTYDATDGYVVLFGGANSKAELGDTWTFSAGVWTQLEPFLSPYPRAYASMTYDVKDGYVVLFGGYEHNAYGLGYGNDTWEFWRGQWTLILTTGAVPAEVGAALTYDAKDGYVVLFGGTTYAGTWIYSATLWKQLSTAVSPGSNEAPAMVYDSKDTYVVLFGGYSDFSSLADTWQFVSKVWTQLPLTFPSARESASMAYDPAAGYVVLFGGYGPSGMLGDTWAFYDGVWANITPSLSPSPRMDASMTYDAADGYLVLFGGWYSGYLNDTWKFSAGSWTNITHPVSPPARYAASMAYDAADGYVVLFGGYGVSGYLGDTWTFVGGIWTQIFPATSPSPRYASGIAYDAKDGYVVLFAGYNSSGYFDDTWEFVGGVWTLLAPSTAPWYRSGPSMTYDSKDGYVLLFGGSYDNDTWTFANGQWTHLTPSISPVGRFPEGLAYDAQSGYTVMFGGDSYTWGDLSDTWTYAGGSWTPLAISRMYSGTFTVNSVVSIGTTALLDLMFPNGTSEFVLFDVTTDSTYVVQWVPAGPTAPTLVSPTAAGDVFYLAWRNASTGIEYWQTITLGGSIAYPVLPVNHSLQWQFVYGNLTTLYMSVGNYLVEVNPTSYALVANYSKPIPTNVSLNSVLPLGTRLYLAGSWSLANGSASAYFGYLDLTTNKVTKVSKLVTNYPSDNTAGFYSLVASGSSIYVGGTRWLYIASPFRWETLEGYLYEFTPATSSFKNLSSLLPVQRWGVWALEPWGSTIALSLTGTNANSATSLKSVVGGLYALSPKGTSLVNETYLLPKGYVADLYLETSESGSWLFSGGANLIAGVSEVVSIPV